MSAPETVLSSTYLFKGRVVVLRQDTILLGTGKEVLREIVEHDPAVVIVPFQAPNTLYLIRQYRRATKSWIYEIPAGIMDSQERPIEAAKRELKEETGIEAVSWTPLFEGYPSPGFCDEYMYFYLAQNLTLGDTKWDEDEQIELFPVSVAEAMAMIERKEIVDLKTILGCAWLQLKGYVS